MHREVSDIQSDIFDMIFIQGLQRQPEAVFRLYPNLYHSSLTAGYGWGNGGKVSYPRKQQQ